jgi:predicted metal-dependent hydrolase
MEQAERREHMDAGRDAFRRGEFYEAHEHWEAVWDEADDAERPWLQGLIQIATGLHKVSQGRSDVGLRLLRSALGKLAGAPPALDGLDLGRLIADAGAAADALARGERIQPQSVCLRDA